MTQGIGRKSPSSVADLSEDFGKISILRNPPPSFSLETALSEEISKLKYDDRLKIDEEMHGVACRAAKETDELIDLSLALFDQNLNTIKETSNPSLNVLRNVIRMWPTPVVKKGPKAAEQLNCYLNNRNIRLRFLRCELFNVEKAVQRFIDFLEFMSELFGDFVVERPVKYTDFNKKEESYLLQSRVQYLAFRDRSGRRVMTAVGNCNFHIESLVTRYKIMMYLHWVVSEDIETQIKGVVVVTWLHTNSEKTWDTKIRSNFNSKMPEYHEKHNKSMPVRVVSWHQFYDDTPYARIRASLYVFSTLRSPYRSVFKIHFGAETEQRYVLAGYGVPAELLPISSSGTEKFENHRDWLKVVRHREWLDIIRTHTNLKDDIVDCPRFNDVVQRKGPSMKLNRGNVYYRELIEDLSLKHFTATNDEKYDITKLVIKKVEERGGRFLEWKNKMWVVVKDTEQARKKVAAAFKQMNRDRAKESDDLIQAIQNVTDILNDDNEDLKPDVPLEYAFMDNPAKRMRTTGINDKMSCFNKCFYTPTDGIVQHA